MEAVTDIRNFIGEFKDRTRLTRMTLAEVATVLADLRRERDQLRVELEQMRKVIPIDPDTLTDLYNDEKLTIQELNSFLVDVVRKP